MRWPPAPELGPRVREPAVSSSRTINAEHLPSCYNRSGPVCGNRFQTIFQCLAAACLPTHKRDPGRFWACPYHAALSLNYLLFEPHDLSACPAAFPTNSTPLSPISPAKPLSSTRQAPRRLRHQPQQDAIRLKFWCLRGHARAHGHWCEPARWEAPILAIAPKEPVCHSTMVDSPGRSP